MKIEYRKGNLLSYVNPNKNEWTAIIHSANNKGVMGSGVAKAIITQYPMVKEDYLRRYWADGELTLGSYIPSFVSVLKIVFTIIGQDGYGYDGNKYVDYNALMRGFVKINKLEGFAELAMPRIGAGLGGGDWSVIEKIIENEFTNKKVIVYEL